jgi:hypothetical protein
LWWLLWCDSSPFSNYSHPSTTLMHLLDSFPKGLAAGALILIFFELVLLDLEILNIGFGGWLVWGYVYSLCSFFRGLPG